LQRSAVDGRYKELDVHGQVAADALAVPHHAAEALLRLGWARLARNRSPDRAAYGRRLRPDLAPIEDVITRLNDSANAPNPGERMLRVLIPSGALEAARSNVEIIDAANIYVDWLAYAVDLFGPAQIDTQAANNNKVKHGLAVRARSDMRVTFVAQRPTMTARCR
jgi:hypothetical protein